MTRRSKRRAMTAILVAIGLWGAWWVFHEQPRLNSRVDDIVVAVYEGDVSLLVYLAEDLGYFFEQNLNVSLKEFEAGKLATDALLAGEADIATGGELVFITNLAKHPDLRCFGTVSAFRIDELIARRDKGIREPKDLRGKRIGVLEQATSEFFLGRFLSMHGLSYDDVEIVYVTPSELVASLLDGRIDAAQTWDPNIYDLKRALGDNGLSFPHLPGQEPIETFLLMTQRGWLANHPDAARRFMRALVEAEAYARSSPAAVKQFMTENFGRDAAYVEYVYPKIDFKVELTQALLIIMDDETRWAIANDIVPFRDVPNYLDFMYLDALDTVSPESVHIIR